MVTLRFDGTWTKLAEISKNNLEEKMHGRVKVRSTAEQEEAKRKEREEKVRVYREITGKIYKKRLAGDLDDDALKLTKDVLSQNPEIVTFWNYRREVLEERRKTLQPEEFGELCKKELSLLEFCLRVNPKSYGIWLHRQWITTHSPSPDWTNEKNLCDLFLKYDERNFHCWDYRRFVISKSDNVTPKDEFDFTYDKIAANFSNYSAWHYRSKLLPVLHPSSSHEGGVAEDALKKEYELVQNAFFTDPSDQSSWFYHRWLLGKGEKPLSVACVLVQRSPQPTVCVAFNQHVRVTESSPIQIKVGETPVNISMKSDWPESFHLFPLPTNSLSPSIADDIKVQVKYDILEATVLIKKDDSEAWWMNSPEEIVGSSLTVATTSILQSELDSCLELLQLEPDNKWCVLTTLHLMQALDAQKYHDEIIKMLKQLSDIDPHRQGHYSDLLSKFTIERFLRSQLATSSRTLDLSNKDLSHLFYLEYMLLIQNLNLSNNHLQSLPSKIPFLVSLTTMALDDNHVKQLPPEVGCLKGLKVLSLRNNNINELDSLKYLQSVQTLEALNLAGNPVCELLSQEEIRGKMKEILPQLRELDGNRID